MITQPRFFLTCVVTVLTLSFAACAEAHNRSQSFSSWTISDEKLEMVFTVKAREVTRLPPLEGELQSLEALLLAHLQHNISVHADKNVCPAVGLPTALFAAPGYVRASWAFQCPTAAIKTIRNDTFFAVAPSHVHFARIAFGDKLPQEYLFTENARRHEVAAVNTPMHSFYRAFVQYTALGVEHIFGGLDHIAFLVALLLLFRQLREVIWMVSGFTVGHSITLSLSALGVLVPNISIIEALIGFTIALVALENIGAITGANRQLSYAVAAVLGIMALVSITWGGGLPLLTVSGLALFTLAWLPLSGSQRSAARMRPLLTLAFGLIHGFGFASVLSEIGLPANRLITALAGFNLGVELGQVLIVSAVWYTALWVRRTGLIQNYRTWLDTASAALCGLGSYWFIARSFA